MKKHYDESILLDYLYGELSSRSQDEISEHLNVCEPCREYLEYIQTIGFQLDSIQEQPADEGTFQLIMESVKAKEELSDDANQKASFVPYIILSAGMLLLILVIYLFQNQILNLTLLKPLESFDFWIDMGTLWQSVSVMVIIGILIGTVMSVLLMLESEKEIHGRELINSQ